MEKQTTTLGLNDTYPMGDLAGCTTREAINHNPVEVRKYLESHQAILDGPAIKKLVNVEMKRKYSKPKRNGTQRR